MTARSKRRAAEVAVIDVASSIARLVTRDDLPADSPWVSRRISDLVDAVHNLESLGLADPGRARFNRGAPPTSQQAAAWTRGPQARAMSARIVRTLYNRAVTGYTAHELIEALGSTHQSVSARVNELRNTGWIVDTGMTRPTPTGRDAIVWKLSRPARTLMQEQT